MRSFKKKYYFECELGPRGLGVLRQTRLSFSGTPSTPSRTGDGHGRGGTSYINFSSPTVLGGIYRQLSRTEKGDEKCTD